MTAAIEGRARAGVPWVVVGMHKPCLSTGVHSCDVGPDLLHLLVSERVDLVISGHEHMYERTRSCDEGPGCPRITIGSFTRRAWPTPTTPSSPGPAPSS